MTHAFIDFISVGGHASDNRRMQGALGIFGFDSRATCKLRVQRLLDIDRVIRTRASISSMCCVLFLAIFTLPYVHAATEIDKEQLTTLVDESIVNLSGVVKSPDGKPVEGALVTITTAGGSAGWIERVPPMPVIPACTADMDMTMRRTA